jgi:hypothetical protein
MDFTNGAVFAYLKWCMLVHVPMMNIANIDSLPEFANLDMRGSHISND